MNIIYIDFETTGLDPRNGAAPIELAALLLTPKLEKISAYQTGIMGLLPGDVIYETALAVNKITPEQIALGRRPGLCADEFINWLDAHQGNKPATLTEEAVINPVMLAGHNVSFDRKFLEYFLERAGIPAFMNRFHYRQIDAQPIAWAMLTYHGHLEKTSLQNCTAFFGIEHTAHRAMGDVEAGVEVLRRLVQHDSFRGDVI